MRWMVPLLLAAALAIGGWMATGVVTVRSVAEPARIGLLPPPRTLVTLLLPLLALGGLAPAGTWRSVAAVTVLLVPIVAAWLPLPLPPAALVWTGPMAVAWWAACVAYAYAVALRPLSARLHPILGSPRRAPVAAAVSTGVLLTLTAWHTAPQHPRGDEPDYLVITQSLLLDRDLQIENNHARADYAAYHSGVLPPSYLQRGRNGAIYSVHAPGLPALLVPGFGLAGTRGAAATLILIAMAGAWLAWRTCWRVTHDLGASWFGTIAAVGAAPFFLHAGAVFPDAPASVGALLAVDALLDEDDRPARWFAVAVALALLPWLHTRYAVIAAGLGAAVVVRLATRAAWRTLAAFAVPAAVAAIAWFGFFVVVYGTPDPSAPYGRYTQMALAHLRPGVPGLLVDQQFGLLASAPVLAVAVMAVRRGAGTFMPRTYLVSAFVLALALGYTCLVAAYRMWWGGLSAPARFLVPLVLPLAPLLAVGWQSLWTRAGRHLAAALLACSLVTTAALVVVDEGALAYNVRDGAARLAAWAGPLVDLVAALPAAHRDPPEVVVRDAAVWIAVLGVAFAVWRLCERRGRLTPLVTMLTVAAIPPAAAAVVWAMHGTTGLAPSPSQVRYLQARAHDEHAVLMTISPPPVGRTRTWFDVEIDSRRNRGAADFTLLRPGRLPAGRYRLHSTIAAPGARLGVAVGEERSSRFLAALPAADASRSAAFTLALPADTLVVKGSREAAAAPGRVWLTAEEVWPEVQAPPAIRLLEMGDRLWQLPGEGLFGEPDGVWIAGDAVVTVGVDPAAPMPVTLRAGAADVEVRIAGASTDVVSLPAGATREVELRPRDGRVRLETRGGFRPAHATPGSEDMRWLGVFVSPGSRPDQPRSAAEPGGTAPRAPGQNRATPIT